MQLKLLVQLLGLFVQPTISVALGCQVVWVQAMQVTVMDRILLPILALDQFQQIKMKMSSCVSTVQKCSGGAVAHLFFN